MSDAYTTFTVSNNELYRWGCPHCGYRSGSTSISHAGWASWRCGDCTKYSDILADGMTVYVNGTTKLVLQDHPRRGIPAEGRRDARPTTGGEFFSSRGVGTDSTPGCWICKTATEKRSMHNNISAFVQHKDAGDRIVRMLGYGAYVDYRTYEPDRVQVKVGTCLAHVPHLNLLHDLTSTKTETHDAGIITNEIIAQAVAGATAEKETNDVVDSDR